MKKEIVKLKKKAKELYCTYKQRAEDYDCGIGMMEFINPDMRKMRNEFEIIMKKLSEIDPECKITLTLK